jgi:AraC family ethanolamine operon transcriptional activator
MHRGNGPAGGAGTGAGRPDGPAAPPGPFDAGLAGTLDFDDFDAFARAAPRWEHRIQQIGRGRPSIRLRMAQTSRVQLGLVRRGPGTRMEGLTPRGAPVFMVRLRGDLRVFGRRCQAGDLAHLPGGEPFELHDPGSHALLSLSLDQALLDRALGSRDVAPPPDRPGCAWPQLRDARARGSLLRAAARWIARASRDRAWLLHPGRAAALEDGVVSALLDALDPGSGARPAPVPSTRLARRAEELLRAHLEQPLAVRELAREVGMPLRTLHASFLGHYGMAPKAYLRALRLDAARRALERAEPGARVADVAVRWCFYHLGRFSADYHRAFGELPSVTLRRATRGSGAPGGEGPRGAP